MHNLSKGKTVILSDKDQNMNLTAQWLPTCKTTIFHPDIVVDFGLSSDI